MNTLATPVGESILIYVADPMCSWCWGFAKSVAAVRDAFPRSAFRLVLGGLRPGPAAQPLNGELRGYLREAWTRVHERSGQPFDWSVLDWPNFLYDTDPPSRAVVAMREMAPDRELDYFFAIQRAFYGEGRDITQKQVQTDIAGSVGVDPDAYREALDDDRLRQLTQADYEFSRSLGVGGFPTLLASVGGAFKLLASGFRPPEQTLAACGEFFGEQRRKG